MTTAVRISNRGGNEPVLVHRQNRTATVPDGGGEWTYGEWHTSETITLKVRGDEYENYIHSGQRLVVEEGKA